jgi:hypothetical protein
MRFSGHVMFRHENMYINIIREAKRLSVKDLQDRPSDSVKFNCNNKL